MAEQNATILQISGLTKVFPGVQALSDVNFELNRGEIHALMGENGAGKSTLIKILTGVHRRDAGEIVYDGEPIDCASPLQAQEIGISPVYQEVNLVPNLSVAENLFLGRQPMKGGRIDWKEQNRRAAHIVKNFDLEINVERPLATFSIAIQQMVAIARALEFDAKILILDEPTSSLSRSETDQLFAQMRRLKGDGQSIIFITHFLDQVFEISDRITVLRNGNYIGTYVTQELDKSLLISKLLGQELEKVSQIEQRQRVDADREAAEGLIEAEQLTGTNGIKPFSVKIQAGEVLGCAGLLGSGRTELANTLFGIDPAAGGTMKVNGKEAEVRTPRQALQLGIGLSPEDRKDQGIIGDLTVRENIILALQSRKGWLKTISLVEQERIADEYIKMLNIKTPTAEQQIKNLSGGNQQKVIIARWLAADPQFLILDEPTRGIDVGAKTEIQRLIIELSRRDMAIMFISSEIEELTRCSSKVVVMHELEVAETLYGEDINDESVMQAIVERHADG